MTNHPIEPHPGDNAAPWWAFILLFLAGMALVGAAIDLIAKADLPAIVGVPVCVGLSVTGMLLAVGSLGALFNGQRDTDRNPEGEDPRGLRAEHESGGPEGIAHTQPTIIGESA